MLQIYVYAKGYYGVFFFRVNPGEVSQKLSFFFYSCECKRLGSHVKWDSLDQEIID